MIYGLISSFFSYSGFAWYFPLSFEKVDLEDSRLMYLQVMRSSAHVTFCALIINYLNDKRPISSLGPVVIFFYACVFFEVFAFLILEFVHGINFDFRILLSIFFLVLAIFTHRANLKKKQSIFRD